MKLVNVTIQNNLPNGHSNRIENILCLAGKRALSGFDGLCVSVILRSFLDLKHKDPFLRYSALRFFETRYEEITISDNFFNFPFCCAMLSICPVRAYKHLVEHDYINTTANDLRDSLEGTMYHHSYGDGIYQNKMRKKQKKLSSSESI